MQKFFFFFCSVTNATNYLFFYFEVHLVLHRIKNYHHHPHQVLSCGCWWWWWRWCQSVSLLACRKKKNTSFGQQSSFEVYVYCWSYDMSPIKCFIKNSPQYFFYFQKKKKKKTVCLWCHIFFFNVLYKWTPLPSKS